MGYKSILVCLDQEQTVSSLVSAAVNLSTAGNAQIIGMHTVPGIHITTGAGLHIPVTLYSAIDHKHQLQAEKIKQAYERAIHNVDRNCVWLQNQGQHQFDFRHYIKQSLTCDVVIAAQSEPLIRGIDLPRDLLLEARTPVVVVPAAATSDSISGTDSINIALAWDATPASARAVRDALPVMRAAARVDIVPIDDNSVTNSPNDEKFSEPFWALKNYLQLHGITVKLHKQESFRSSEGARLLDHCVKCNSDLLILGSFSHGRLYETVFGSVTTEVVNNFRIPILLSH